MDIKQVGAGAVIRPELGLIRPAGDTQNRSGRMSSPSARAQIAQEITQADTSTLEFSIDAESDRLVVKIIDSATGELVRQIPMEEMLALAKALGRLKGLLLQTKA